MEMDLQTGVIKAVSTSIRIPVCTEQERTARVKCLGPLFRHTNRLKDIRDSVTVCEAHVIYRVKEKKRKPDLQKANIHTNTRKALGVLVWIF